jgi:hypothetical protein
VVTPQRFVQQFYDWYVPLGLSEVSSGPAWYAALSHNPALLSDDLLRELRADSIAQSGTTDLVGLDFDPYLNSQDPCKRYETAAGVRGAHTYRVPVHAVCAGSRHVDPDVIVEVALINGKWLIRNFVYPPSKTDLLSQLQHRHPNVR